MTERDLLLEQHLIAVSKRPKKDPLDDTITTFNRDVFMYDRSSINHQQEPTKATYEDHRKVIETAVNIFTKDTPHDIAMCILTHRFFESYRNAVFGGKGSFTKDYSFILKKIDAVFNHKTSKVSYSNIPSQIREYKVPTLVQLNHLAGEVTEVKVPKDSDLTLNEWAQRFNFNAPESTSYIIAGLTL